MSPPLPGDGATAAGTRSTATAQAATHPPRELVPLVQSQLVALLDSMPGAVAATIVTVTRTGLRPWAAAGADGHLLDRVQTRARQGPGFAAARQAEPVVTADLFTDERWHLPRPEQQGPRAVLAMVLPGSPRDPVVLSVYGQEGAPAQLVHPDRLAAAVADLSSVVCVVRARQLVEDLRTALSTNRAIGAAVGIAMVHRQLTYDAAVDLLHTLSNLTNTRLADLADAILFTGQIPAGPAPLPGPGR